MSTDLLLLGVDGGGSKTRAWIAATDSSGAVITEPLGRGEAESSNVASVGHPAACRAITKAIAAARSDAGCSAETPLASACIGLAGAGDATLRNELQRWAETAVSPTTIIVTDADLVLHAASGDGVGAALIAGTGSFAFARNAIGETARCGGWGRLLGDAGGGYALAIDALREVARAADGRAAATKLTAAAIDFYSLDDAFKLRTSINTMAPAEIAAFAPTVIDLSSDDSTAESIVRHHADELMQLVVGVLQRIELSPPIRLGLAGSLLTRQPSYRERVEQQIAAQGMDVDIVVVQDPVVGALQVAAQRV